MASTMNSGGSIDLNRIKIYPQTGEKLSFNLDNMMLAWPGSERSFGLFHFFFTSDQNKALIDLKLMAYKTLRF